MTDLREKIIELIPSNDLKHAIKETNLELSEMDFFRIIQECSPNFEKRIECLELLRDNSSEEMAKYAERNIQYEKTLFAYFTKHHENTVFEVYVNDREHYIFKDLEAAIEFTKVYPSIAYASEVKNYHIKKMILREAETFDVDAFEDSDFCVVVGGKIRDIWCEHIELYPECDGNCIECERFCHIKEDSEFPNFIDLGDLIRYPDDFGKTKYAIVLIQPNETFDYVYCLPLDSAAVRYREFDKEFYEHYHPSPYTVEKAQISELDEETRANYFAFREHLGLSTAF